MCLLLAILLVIQEFNSETSQTWLERHVVKSTSRVAADYIISHKIIIIMGIWLQITYAFISPSLVVSLVITKKVHNQFMEWDVLMVDDDTGRPMRAQVSNMNDNLGQVNYLLTDKTGTLTQNVMILRGILAGKHTYPLREECIEVDLLKVRE